MFKKLTEMTFFAPNCFPARGQPFHAESREPHNSIIIQKSVEITVQDM
jgi:hypothetical protein